uniref:Uncharacterized protein n=1 Tax=viral metagenome TaxID=1070528 RepID=A0A6C0EKC3_9ZZZZ
MNNLEDVTGLITKFNGMKDKYYSLVEEEFKKYIQEPNNKSLLKCLYIKYPYLKRSKRLNKRSKIIKEKAFISELLEDPYFSTQFTKEEKDNIYRYCILKIRGLYKHAQALKTGYCNGQIINAFSEENTLSVCITKNTLEANEQWLSRLFKELDNRYPHVGLGDKIMIISSKNNDLNGNATHCKDLNDAWSYLKKKNNFKIVFICSNKTRIQDILEMAESFLNLKDHLKKTLRILHDEAHNSKEAIPFRNIIENILPLINVLSYQPITASNNSLIDTKNPIWNKENLEKNAINFTQFDKTKSDDLKYSSCNDSIKLNFEELKKHPNWKNYNVEEVSRELFIEVDHKYKNKVLEELGEEELKDVDKRRQLEFCQFMKNNKEEEAVNNGINSLNLNNLINSDYFIKDAFNIHIMSTPNRKIITHLLSKEALKMDFNPIVLAVYGNEGDKYHLFHDSNDAKCVDTIMGEGEFNDKLLKLINYLKEQHINIKRPFIIIGNYTPTGESLSYVHYEYGTIRSVIRLISTNAEEDYQSACRGNYMNTKFIEKDPNWTQPIKYLVGQSNFINNALSYEAENDARIDYLELNPKNEDENGHSTILPILSPPKSRTAIPIKITLDRSDPLIQDLVGIALIPKKNQDQKEYFLLKLKKCCEDDEVECEIEDKTGKFNWEMRIKDFRQYSKKNINDVPKLGYWKFKSYQINFEVGTPFINNTSGHSIGDCDLLVCNDQYLLKNEQGGIKEINKKSTWWMGYKYL